MQLDALQGMAKGEPPPALDAACQLVRAAGVLLPREQDFKSWGKERIEQVKGKPVYSL